MRRSAFLPTASPSSRSRMAGQRRLRPAGLRKKRTVEALCPRASGPHALSRVEHVCDLEILVAQGARAARPVPADRSSLSFSKTLQQSRHLRF
jgi:hypothetical protein